MIIIVSKLRNDNERLTFELLSGGSGATFTTPRDSASVVWQLADSWHRSPGGPLRSRWFGFQSIRRVVTHKTAVATITSCHSKHNIKLARNDGHQQGEESET